METIKKLEITQDNFKNDFSKIENVEVLVINGEFSVSLPSLKKVGTIDIRSAMVICPVLSEVLLSIKIYSGGILKSNALETIGIEAYKFYEDCGLRIIDGNMQAFSLKKVFGSVCTQGKAFLPNLSYIDGKLYVSTYEEFGSLETVTDRITIGANCYMPKINLKNTWRKVFANDANIFTQIAK